MIAYHTELQIEMTKRRSRTHNTTIKRRTSLLYGIGVAPGNLLYFTFRIIVISLE